MNQVVVRNITLGDGKCKICLPIVGNTAVEVQQQAQLAVKHEPDILEFRADWFEGVFEKAKLISVLQLLRETVGEIPILFTFRTKQEGGEKSISFENYREILLIAAQSEMVDAIDVEAFFNYELRTGKKLDLNDGNDINRESVLQYQDQEGIACLIQELKDKNMVVIASNHDFQKTPVEQEIYERLVCMKKMGADVSKIAVMPQSTADVLTLLQATNRLHNDRPDILVITMSMGSLGVISRITGSLFGSVLTFGSAGKASAPGQVEIEKLREIMDVTN